MGKTHSKCYQQWHSQSTLLCVKFGERGTNSTLVMFEISIFPHFPLHEPPCAMMGQSSVLFGFPWVEQWKIINTNSVLERTVIGHPAFWFPDTHPELGFSPAQMGTPLLPLPWDCSLLQTSSLSPVPPRPEVKCHRIYDSSCLILILLLLYELRGWIWN